MPSARLLSFMLVAIIVLQVIASVRSISNNLDQQHQRRFSPMSFEQFGVDSNYRSANRVFDDEESDKDMMVHQKRQVKKKWAKLYQDSHSPYTIAFPALIRTRRSTRQGE